MNPQPRLVYLAATGRAGSTLLELLLSTAPGVMTVGELQVLAHEYGEGAHLMGCGCGLAVPDCPFWQQVRAGVDDPTITELARFREHHNAGRTLRRDVLIRSLRRDLDRSTAEAVDRYAISTVDILTEVRRVAAEEGRPVSTVVDASKDPYRLLWLARSGRFDLWVVHLTRHPAAFARSVLRRSHPDAGAVETVTVAARKAISWDVTTSVCLASRRFVSPDRWRELTYERLAREPENVMAELAAWLGLDVPSDAVEQYRTVVTHAIAGNPMRSARRPISLDDAWRSDLPAVAKAAVGVLTWPVRWRLARAQRARSSYSE